ncbi:MAG: hypothetical protein H6684_08960 [Deltaproteobacteria bacterium]|nr:hypothetical protein [bacterium]MCB9476663.1 hypothetical protein [Deltaproteobacteria bacterium]MCB9479610.1 hypothetical protein [Deltaproteobacteria bacterium]MCB9488846.1 hypothetical protein [Deltaproteobacteria bacterium]
MRVRCEHVVVPPPVAAWSKRQIGRKFPLAVHPRYGPVASPILKTKEAVYQYIA